jgi:hypothetical protein
MGVSLAVLVMLSPLAAGALFTPPYSNYTSTFTPSTSGQSGSNSWSAFSPSTGNGTLYFWHSSSAGQTGPAYANLEAFQGFNTSKAFIQKGGHTVSLTWQFSGEEYLSVTCYSGTGAGTASAQESVEFNVWDFGTSSWLFASNHVISVWSYSLSCPTGGYASNALSGTPTFLFSTFTIPSGHYYSIWGFLDTVTNVSEPSISDMNGTACTDYALTPSSCWGSGSGSGYAQLTKIELT